MMIYNEVQKKRLLDFRMKVLQDYIQYNSLFKLIDECNQKNTIPEDIVILVNNNMTVYADFDYTYDADDYIQSINIENTVIRIIYNEAIEVEVDGFYVAIEIIDNEKLIELINL